MKASDFFLKDNGVYKVDSGMLPFWKARGFFMVKQIVNNNSSKITKNYVDQATLDVIFPYMAGNVEAYSCEGEFGSELKPVTHRKVKVVVSLTTNLSTQIGTYFFPNASKDASFEDLRMACDGTLMPNASCATLVQQNQNGHKIFIKDNA